MLYLVVVCCNAFYKIPANFKTIQKRKIENMKISNCFLGVFFALVVTGVCPMLQAEDSKPELKTSSTLDTKKLDETPILSNVEMSQLYLADGTGVDNMGAYSHHPHVIYHAGLLYATWSNHLQDEDGGGQRVLIRQSKDLGKTWVPPLSERPAVLFPQLSDWKKRSDKILDSDLTGTSNGFAVIDGCLYAVNEVLKIGIGYQQIGKGRLVRRINDDGTFGETFWIEPKAPEIPQGFPNYPDLSDPKFAEIGKKINVYLHDKQRKHLLTWDFKGERNTTTELEPGHTGSPPDRHALCEPTVSYQTPDGVLAMFWRDLGGRAKEDGAPSLRLYQSVSFDDGEHWSIPERTTIPNCNSRPCAGNLPDGTVYLLNNPISRKHLILSLSKDGKTFDRHWLVRRIDHPQRFQGLYKGNYQAAYQHACFAKDFLFVIYSVNKEDVELVRIPIQSLKYNSR